IVLIVISLIAGGIILGQNLLQASKAQGLAKQIQEIDTAVNIFQTTYGCLPGDCIDITNHLTGTTNGDGSNFVNHRYSGTAQQRLEHLTFWPQLGVAGLRQGSYTGTGGSGDTYDDAEIGINLPVTDYASVGLSVYNHKINLDAWTVDFGV